MSSFFINLDLISKERFDAGKFFEYVGDNYDPLTSSFLAQLENLSEFGRYVVAGEDNKPDLVSYRIYGDTQYWWLLLYYNKRLEYTEFATGDIVRYPSLADLENIYFRLKASKTAAG